MVRLKPWEKRPVIRRKRVGIVGLLQSGKTVLLTSLIDHLKNHDPDELPIGTNGTVVTEIDSKMKPTPGMQQFDFMFYRSNLGNHRWPEKTLQMCEYRAVYTRSDRPWTRCDMSFFDIPGERLADLGIFRHRQFANWSDEILETLRSCVEFRDQADLFLGLLEQLERRNDHAVDEESLLVEYRRALARLVTSYMPIVSPSSFLVDPQGNYVPDRILNLDDPGKLLDGMIQNQYTGLDRSRQFAPLTEKLRNRDPELTKRLSARYRDYRKDLVQPFAQRLSSCHELVVLVDVAMLLEGGVGMFNANRVLLELMIEGLNPGLTWSNFGLRSFGLGNRIRRIIFVANKADRVHSDDRGHLEHLLKKLADPLVKGLKNVKWLDVEYLVCAAVESTRSDSNGNQRILQFQGDDGNPTQKIPVPVVPAGWPNNWSHGQYQFPNPPPGMPRNNANPPSHVGLHCLAELILS